MARRTRRGKSAKAFVSQPVGAVIGSVQKGLQLAAGNFLVDGKLFKEPNEPIWEIESDSIAFQTKAQSFFWLDHFAANGSELCRSKSRTWFTDWFTRFGDGDNFAWTPELAGARVIRMINHAILLLGNTAELPSEFYFASISHHARFLKKRWHSAPEGLPKFQALVGYVYSALALEEFSRDLKPALRALTKECEQYIESDGGIPTRNPEELLEIFTLLVWVDQGMTTASLKPDRALLRAIERIAPVIRTLRLGDGKLVEFHGGRMADGQRIDRILSDSGSRAKFTSEEAMGYTRISNGASVLVIDTAPAPTQHRTDTRCGSALAFEFSSGSDTIFRSVGSGRDFGDVLRKAGQVTSAFSVASIQPYNASQAGKARKISAALARDTQVILSGTERGPEIASYLEAQHTGYRSAYGLTYRRMIELSENGYVLSGTDGFYCQNEQDQQLCDLEAEQHEHGAIPCVVRFHISPELDAELDLGGSAVSLKLPNGEIWVFKAAGGDLALEASAHFEADRLKPRATKQIVVSSSVVNYEGAVTWMLTRLES